MLLLRRKSLRYRDMRYLGLLVIVGAHLGRCDRSKQPIRIQAGGAWASDGAAGAGGLNSPLARVTKKLPGDCSAISGRVYM